MDALLIKAAQRAFTEQPDKKVVFAGDSLELLVDLYHHACTSFAKSPLRVTSSSHVDADAIQSASSLVLTYDVLQSLVANQMLALDCIALLVLDNVLEVDNLVAALGQRSNDGGMVIHAYPDKVELPPVCVCCGDAQPSAIPLSTTPPPSHRYMHVSLHCYTMVYMMLSISLWSYSVSPISSMPECSIFIIPLIPPWMARHPFPPTHGACTRVK